MSKKIIAVSLAMLMMVVAFVGCTKSELYVDKDGHEHLLMLDKEGNTVLNDNGKIIVYVTEADGDIKKDNEGKPMTALIDFPEKMVKDDTVATPYYSLTLPKTWKLQEDGDFIYSENEKIRIKVEMLDLDEGLTLEDYMKKATEAGKEFSSAIEKKYNVKFTDELTKATVTEKNHSCYHSKITITKEDIVKYYVESINFKHNDKIYKISLECEENSYSELEEKIDFFSLVNINLKTKEI